jgi:hypothetical protein
MKPFFIVLSVCFGYTHVCCQSNAFEIKKQIIQYYIDNSSNESTCFTIYNNSNEDVFFWFDKSPRAKMDSSLYKRYFQTVHGDFSLLQLLADQSIDSFRVILFKSFVKKLLPHAKFEVIFNIGRDNAKDEIQSFESHIVHFWKSELPSAYISVLRVANDKLFKEDKIVLYRNIVQH